jgi:hypothetical protein
VNDGMATRWISYRERATPTRIEKGAETVDLLLVDSSKIFRMGLRSALADASVEDDLFKDRRLMPAPAAPTGPRVRSRPQRRCLWRSTSVS